MLMATMSCPATTSPRRRRQAMTLWCHQDWVQELKNEDIVNAVHIETHKNLADMLTKGLSAEVRNRLEQCLNDIAEAVASETGRQVHAKSKVSARAAK